MISVLALVRNIRAAWQLALRNPDSMADFDASPTGFWQSFWAVALVTPPLFLMDVIQDSRLYDLLGPGAVVAMLLAYILDAVAFPVVMLSLADRMGLWPRYPLYIVANNWSQVVQTALLFPIVLLLFSSGNSESGGIFLLLTFGLILFYRAYITHLALNVHYGVAAALVLLQVLLSLSIQQGLSAILLKGAPV